MAAIIVIAGAAALISVWSGPARAQQLPATLNENMWVVNGPVAAIAMSGNTVYIGGGFTQVGQYMGCGIPIEESSGYPLATYPKVNGTVYTVASDGSGGWYIGGSFTKVGSSLRNNIAHVESTGAVDAAWNPGANSWVNTLAVNVKTGTVYVGGNFTKIGGQTRNYIAALKASSGSVLASWNPNAGSWISALVVSGNTVYAGGYFTKMGGLTRNRIAALDATTGKVTSWNPNANSTVYALAVGYGAVYAGGDFTKVSGKTRSHLAAITAASGNLLSWNPGASDDVYALALGSVSSGMVYAGGAFTQVGTLTRNYLAAINYSSTGKVIASWNPGSAGANSGVYVLAVSNGTLYAGGGFTSMGGKTRNYLAALNATSGSLLSWNPNANMEVQALAVSGSTVYAGGNLTSLGGETRNYIAALDATTGKATSWNPNASSYVYALVVGNGAVYAGGDFTKIGGQTRYYIAALSPSSGNALSWNPGSAGANGDVYVLAVSNGTLYAGGDFTKIGGQTRYYIAAINATSGSLLSWNPGANSWVHALAVGYGAVYAGGGFSKVGGVTRNHLAAISATSGGLLSWNPDAEDDVYTLALGSVSSRMVYAGGAFTKVGTLTRNYLAAIDYSTGKVISSWNPGADNAVESFAFDSSGGNLYVGGAFETIGGVARDYIAALNASTGKVVSSWNPGADYPVYAFDANGGTLYVGGTFGTIDGEWRPGFVQLK
jgi:predicted small secreted protein